MTTANTGPNRLRGYIPIMIASEEYFLRFSWSAMRQLMEILGKDSVQDMLNAASEWKADEIIQCIVVGLRHGSFRGKEISTDEIEDLLLLNEVRAYTEALTEGFSAFMTGKSRNELKRQHELPLKEPPPEPVQEDHAEDFTALNPTLGGH
jgi:hypothetical protein